MLLKEGIPRGLKTGFVAGLIAKANALAYLEAKAEAAVGRVRPAHRERPR
jgi:hypothetical protein